MKDYLTKEFSNEREEFDYMASNQSLIKAQRNSESKCTDSFSMQSYAINNKGERLKSEDESDKDTGVIKIKAVINATNILDSHKDLHLPGIWKKSISEKKLIYLCQEHNLSFKGIITDNVKAYTETKTFKEIGYDLEGNTELLIFEAEISKERNPYMYEQYKKGYVRNHSVRMRYVKELFCMNSEESDHTQYKENWDKYYPMIANKEAAEKIRWFYAVKEAKVQDEGSAVVKGSNEFTPTVTVEEVENKQAVDKTLETQEPLKSTQETRRKVFIN